MSNYRSKPRMNKSQCLIRSPDKESYCLSIVSVIPQSPRTCQNEENLLRQKFPTSESLPELDTRQTKTLAENILNTDFSTHNFSKSFQEYSYNHKIRWIWLPRHAVKSSESLSGFPEFDSDDAKWMEQLPRKKLFKFLFQRYSWRSCGVGDVMNFHL